MSERNKKVVRELYAAISKGDLETYMSYLADDVQWYFIGTHRFGGTFKGKDEIVSKLLTDLAADLEGMIELEIKQLIADGDKVVAEMQGRAMSKAGKAYNNTYCIILTLRDGIVQEIREYLDTELVTEVFGR